MRKISKIITIISVFIFIMMFTGCMLGAPAATEAPTPDPDATPRPQTDPEQEYTLFENEDFSIEYNSTWEIRDNAKEDGSALTVTVPEAGDATQTYPILSVYSEKYEPDGFNFEDKVRQNIEYMTNNVNKFTLFNKAGEPEYAIITVDGETGYCIEYAGNIQGTPEVRVKQIIINKADKVFVITYSAPSTDYVDEGYGKVVEKTIDSFKFK